MKPEQFISAYEIALASQQWKNIAPLIHENACVTFSTGSVHKGMDAIRQAYERNFSNIKNEAYAMTDLHWIMQSERVAVYVFNFNWKGIINGQPAQGAGRGTAVIAKENGEWNYWQSILDLLKGSCFKSKTFRSRKFLRHRLLSARHCAYR